MIKYCRRCVMPSTKPDLHIDEEGVCSGCRNIEKRKEVDWARRKQELYDVVEKYRREGVDVTYRRFHFGEHMSVALTGIPSALRFLSEQFG